MVVVRVEVGLLFGHEDALQGGEFRHFLRAEVVGVVQNETIAVAQDVGGEPARETQTACADNGGKARFHERLSRLEVLAGDGHLRLFGEFPHSGNIHGRIGSAHDEGCAFRQCSVGVAHGGGDAVAVVGLHGCFEGSEGAVHFVVNGHVDFGACGPDNDHALAAVFCLESADIFAQCLYHFPARLAVLHVRAVKTLGIVVVEGGLHRHDGLQFVFNGQNILGAEHFGIHSALKGVGGIYVPGAEDEVFQFGQRHDFAIVEILCIFAFTHTNFVVLGHRTNGFGQALASHQHTRNHGGGDSAKADAHHTEFS